MQDQIRVVSLNTRGALGNIECISEILCREKPTFLCLQETFLSQHQKVELERLTKGFSAVIQCSDRDKTPHEAKFGQGKVHHGTAILYPSKLDKYVTIVPTASPRITALKLETGNGTQVLVMSVYLPSSRGYSRGVDYSEEFRTTTHAMKAVIDDNADEHTRIIIAGDVNVQTHEKCRQRKVDWMKFLKKTELTECRTEGPTHRPDNPDHMPSTLDTISIDSMTEVLETWIMDENHYPNNQSDHYPLKWDLVVKRQVLATPPKKERVSQQDRPIKVHPVPDWDKVDILQYKMKVSDILTRCWSHIKDLQPVIAIVTIGHIMETCATECQLKVRKSPRKKEGKVTREKKLRIEITKISNIVRNLEKKYNEILDNDGEIRRPEEVKAQLAATGEALLAARQKRKSYRSLMEVATGKRKKARIVKEQVGLMNIFKNDKNKVFQEIEKLKGLQRAGMPEALDIDGVVYAHGEVLDGFATYAAKQSTSKRWEGESSLLQNRIDETIEMCRVLATDDPNEFSEITKERFEEILAALPGGKGGDLQGLQLEHIKNVDDDTREIIREMINKILPGIPTSYSNTLINTRIATMIYKGKSKPKNKVSSYRRVSIGSIFQKIIDQQMIKYAGKLMKEAQSKRQFGFTEKLAINQCVLLRELAIQQSEEFGEPLYILAADVSAAFSSTERSNQLFELLRSGESTKMFDYSDATYRNTTVYMKGGKEISMMIVENIGAPQGGKKSAPDFKGYNQPLIRVIDNSGIGYSLMIHRGQKDHTNKVSPDGIEKEVFGIILVADDSLAMATSEAEIMAIIHAYEKYAEEYFLDFAFSKVILNVYGDKKALARHKEEKVITINGHQPIYADESVHLGTIVCADPKKTNMANIQNRIRATNAKLFHLLGTVVNTKRTLSQELQREAYLTYIRSSLKSTLECFPFKDSEMKVLLDYEKKQVRNIFKYHKRSKVTPAYLYLGMAPIDAVIHMDMFSLFHNIWATKNETETADVCRAFMLKNMKTMTWPVYIRNLAAQYGIIDPLICLSEDAPSKEVWSGYVKKRIYHYHEMAMKSKVNTYKSTPYLNVNGLSLRNKPSQILLSAATPYEAQSCNVTLKHLTGDYPNAVNLAKGPGRDVSCKLCRMRDISISEDSYHNLVGCPFIWEDDRVIKFFSEYVRCAAAAWDRPVYETWRALTSDKNCFVQMVLDPLSENLPSDCKIIFADIKGKSEEEAKEALERNKILQNLIAAGQKFVKVCDETRANLFKRHFGTKNISKPGPNGDAEDVERRPPAPPDLSDGSQGNASEKSSETTNKNLNSQTGAALQRYYGWEPADFAEMAEVTGREPTLDEVLPESEAKPAHLVGVIAGYEAMAVFGSVVHEGCDDTHQAWKYAVIEATQAAKRWSGGLQIMAENQDILSRITLMEGAFTKRQVAAMKISAGITYGSFVGEEGEEEIPATLVFLESNEDHDIYHSGIHDAETHLTRMKKLLITTKDFDPTALSISCTSPYAKVEIIEMSFGADNWFPGSRTLAENPRQYVERLHMLGGLNSRHQRAVVLDLAFLLNMGKESLIHWAEYMEKIGMKRDKDHIICEMLMMSENSTWPVKQVTAYQSITARSSSILPAVKYLQLRQERRLREKLGITEPVAPDSKGKKQIKMQSVITNFIPVERDPPATPATPISLRGSSSERFLLESGCDDPSTSLTEMNPTNYVYTMALQVDGCHDIGLDGESNQEMADLLDGGQGDNEDIQEILHLLDSNPEDSEDSVDLSNLCSCLNNSVCRSTVNDQKEEPGEGAHVQHAVDDLTIPQMDGADDPEEELDPAGDGRNILNILTPSEVDTALEGDEDEDEDYVVGDLSSLCSCFDNSAGHPNPDCTAGDMCMSLNEGKAEADKVPKPSDVTSSSERGEDVPQDQTSTPLKADGEKHQPNLEKNEARPESGAGGEVRIPGRPVPSLSGSLSPIILRENLGKNKRKEKPAEITPPPSVKLRPDCSYNGVVLREDPVTKKLEALIVPVLHKNKVVVRTVRMRPRTYSEPCLPKSHELQVASKEDLRPLTPNFSPRDVKKIKRKRIAFAEGSEKKVSFDFIKNDSPPVKMPPPPTNTPSGKKILKRGRGNKSFTDLRQVLQSPQKEKNPVDLRQVLQSPQREKKGKKGREISIRVKTPEVIDLSSSSSSSGSDTSMAGPLADLVSITDLSVRIKGDLNTAYFIANATRRAIPEDEIEAQKDFLKELSLLCREAKKIENELLQAEILLDKVVIDPQAPYRLWTSNVIPKRGDSIKKVGIANRRSEEIAKEKIAAAAVRFRSAKEGVSPRLLEKVSDLLENIVQIEDDLRIIAEFYRFSLSLPKVNNTFQTRKTSLREQVLRSQLTNFLSNYLSVSGREPGSVDPDVHQSLVNISESSTLTQQPPTNPSCSGQNFLTRIEPQEMRSHEVDARETTLTNPERAYMRRVWRPGEEIPTVLFV